MKPPAPSEGTARPTTLVVGYGSTLRGDDGVGPAVAEWVSQQNWPDVEARAIHQLFPEVAEEIAKYDRVIFVDASAGETIRLVHTPLKEASDRLMAHRCSPGALLRMARELYGAHTVGQLITIPAFDFNINPAFSAQTQLFVKEAQELLERLCAKRDELSGCMNLE